MNYINKACSFTGYRTQKLNAALAKGNIGIERIKAALNKEIERMAHEEYSLFLCGMALGGDLLFSELVLEMKRQYPDVKFAAVLPCLDHDKNWDYQGRTRFRRITDKADEIIVVSKTPYYEGCMKKRNQYLIDNCDELLALYDGMPGGTMQTVNMAKAKGKKVTIIDPSKGLKVTLLEFEKNFGERKIDYV